MAVAFDALGPSSAGGGTSGSTTATSASWTHTVGASGNYALVGVSISANSATTSVTFGGVAMTSLGKSQNGGGTLGYTQLFGLANPGTGAKTVTVTCSAASSITGGSLSFSGVNTVGTAVTAATSGNQPSLTKAVTGTTGNMAAGVFGGGSPFGSATPTQEWLRNNNSSTGAGNSIGAIGTLASGTVSFTATFASSGSDYIGFVGVELQAPTTVPISGTDTHQVTEATTTLTSTQSISDTASTADTANTSVSSTASLSDTASTADSVSGINVSASDSGTLTESTSLFQGLTLSGSDSGTFTDSATASATITPTDSGSISETSSIAQTASVSDTGHVTDNAIVTALLNVTDSGSVTETVLPINSNTQMTGTDSWVASESASISASPSATDTVHSTDNAFASDAGTANDYGIFSETATLNQNLAETHVVAETSKISQTVADTFNLAESADAAAVVVDSGTVTESAFITVLASDAIAFTESPHTFADTEIADDDFTLYEQAGANAPRFASDEFALIENAVVTLLPTVFEDNISYPTPSTKTFRIIAQDHFTRQFIHWDLPVDTVQITYSLSGPNLLVCQLSSEMDNIMDLNPPLTPDRTWLHVEENGQIKASFLMTPFIDSPQTQTRQIEGEGFSSYPSWVTYEGANDPPSGYLGVQVDPADMIRKIWSEVQSYPDGDLGVKISATKTPVKIGTPVENVSFTTSEGNQVQFQAGPYTLNWWSVTNCGDEITKLCQQTPLDYVEYSSWNANKTDVDHYIILGYPRVGTKRTDLGFREGENLEMLIPSYQGTNDNYASDVIVVGAGTGPSAVRAIKSGRIGLLRKTSVIQNQEISNHARAQSIANFEYQRLAHSRFLIQNITVDVTHPNAEWGSFNCGDDILVQATVDYVGYIQDWYRITSFTYDPYFKIATINLDPSDSFSYGAENVDPYDELPTSGYAQLDQTQDYSNLWTQTATTTPTDPTQAAAAAAQLEQQKEAYITQVAQQYLCDYFNKNGLDNGQCYYWWWTPNGVPNGATWNVQGVTLPQYSVGKGPLSDLSIVRNNMVIGKTDYGHLMTGNNIQLISSDGTVGQTSNTTSVQAYPQPITPGSIDTDSPIVGEFQITDTDQSTALKIVTYQARHAGLVQFVASDLTIGEALFIRTNGDGSLSLLSGTISSMTVNDMLVIERDNSGTVQVGPGIQINDSEAQLTGLQQAAQYILTEMQSGGQLGSDWSWNGQPAIVGQYNYQLLEMYSGYHNLKPDIFLTAVVLGQIA